jgi:hypothetical protein
MYCCEKRNKTIGVDVKFILAVLGLTFTFAIANAQSETEVCKAKLPELQELAAKKAEHTLRNKALEAMYYLYREAQISLKGEDVKTISIQFNESGWTYYFRVDSAKYPMKQARITVNGDYSLREAPFSDETFPSEPVAQGTECTLFFNLPGTWAYFDASSFDVINDLSNKWISRITLSENPGVENQGNLSVSLRVKR